MNLTLSTLILKDGEQVDFCRELRRGTRIMCSGEQGEQCSNEMAGAKDRTQGGRDVTQGGGSRPSVKAQR